MGDKVVCERDVCEKVVRKTKVLAKCHAWHAKRKLSLSATPATRNGNSCEQVSRLPRGAKIYVAKCNACHAKRRWMSPSATLATQMERQCHQVHPSATSAKWRGAPGDQQRPSVPPEPAKCNKCHACLAKRGSMSPSATPAMRNAGRCRQSQPSAISATLATRNKGRCREVPGLACVVKVHAAKCHAESVCAKVVCERWCVKESV